MILCTTAFFSLWPSPYGGSGAKRADGLARAQEINPKMPGGGEGSLKRPSSKARFGETRSAPRNRGPKLSAPKNKYFFASGAEGQ